MVCDQGDQELPATSNGTMGIPLSEKAPTSEPGDSAGVSPLLKYVSLVVLTVQNAAVILWIRYLRTRTVDIMFLSTTAVVCAEFTKCVSALILLLGQQEWSVRKWLRYLYDHLVMNPVDNVKIAVPALLYTIQNNLQFVAVSNLDAATYQVTYQLKILTTALFSVFLLNKQLTRMQWGSLFALFMGISIVQLQSTSNSAPSSASAAGAAAVPEQSWWVGIVAVVVACLMSGFAGVYFEKILKESQASVWLRNVQLGLLGVVIGLITVYSKDGESVQKNGFFGGYDGAVWLAIGLQSLGGLVVAVVVKYADNILKGFATSAAIVISCIVSIMFLGFVLTLQFVVGAVLVICAVYVYSAYGAKPPPASIGNGGTKV